MDADRVTREAYTHEVISFGFWPGDDNVNDAAYYSYTAPEPAGLRDQPLSVGGWIASGTMRGPPLRDGSHRARSADVAARVLPERLRGRRRPRRWDSTNFTSTWCPSPSQLQELQTSAARQRQRG